MHNIQIGHSIIKQYPETIAEMTPTQFVAFSRLVLQYQAKRINYTQFTVQLTYELLNMKRTVNISKHESAQKIAENINTISRFNASFFEEKHEKGIPAKIIKLDFVKNIIPKIKVGKKWYYGPSDALVNTQFGEYVSALNAYLDFSAEGNEEDLNWLVASLYRPEDINRKKSNLEDTRFSFNKEKVKYYSNKIKTIPFETKYAIYLWFAACQKFIVTSKELTLSGGVSVDLSVLFSPAKPTDNVKGIGMAGAIYTIAETNVFGNAENVAKQNTYDVFLRMLQSYLQAKKLKKDVKNK